MQTFIANRSVNDEDEDEFLNQHCAPSEVTLTSHFQPRSQFSAMSATTHGTKSLTHPRSRTAHNARSHRPKLSSLMSGNVERRDTHTHDNASTTMDPHSVNSPSRSHSSDSNASTDIISLLTDVAAQEKAKAMTKQRSQKRSQCSQPRQNMKGVHVPSHTAHIPRFGGRKDKSQRSQCQVMAVYDDMSGNGHQRAHREHRKRASRDSASSMYRKVSAAASDVSSNPFASTVVSAVTATSAACSSSTSSSSSSELSVSDSSTSSESVSSSEDDGVVTAGTVTKHMFQGLVHDIGDSSLRGASALSAESALHAQSSNGQGQLCGHKHVRSAAMPVTTEVLFEAKNGF